MDDQGAAVPNWIANVSNGDPGDPDPLRLGQKAGTPNPSHHIVWNSDLNCNDSSKRVDYASVDGKSAKGPTNPDHANPKGKLVLSRTSDLARKHPFSFAYFRLKVGQIKDVYYNEQFNNAVLAVNDAQHRLDFVSNTDIQGSPNSLGWTSIQSELSYNQKQKVLYLYNELVRSYNYITLAKFAHPMDAMALTAKVEAILAKDSLSDDPNTLLADKEALRAFYESQVNSIKESLAERFEQGDPLLLVRQGYQELDLLPSLGVIKLGKVGPEL